jgi:hypothetical protein
MDGGWLARLRWRRRGAWMWPLFGLLTVFDAVIGHVLPAAGESESIGGAALLGSVVNLLALAVLSWPGGRLLRRRRPDLPMIVARDYAGSWLMAIAAAGVLAFGLAHRPTIVAHQRALRDAIVRAQAWIGYRAPAEFRRQMRVVSQFTIEPGRIYRICVPSAIRARTYCVVVQTSLPFERSVTFSGYEPNSVFGEGAG